jgi:hypothetical protein
VTENDSSGSRKPPGPFEASGIFAVKTGFLRITQRLRRPPKYPRPPVRWSLVILLAAVLLAAIAGWHRSSLERRFALSVRETAGMPSEIKRVRAELADLEHDESQLGTELDARLKYVQSLKSEEFYIVVDRAKKRMQFKFGDRVVRDAPAEAAPAKTIESGGKRWTFPPLSGAYSIRETLEDPDWTPPEWVYAMNGVPVPSPRPEIESGLGSYVIVLSDDAVIHSPPPDDSPLKGVKPGSIEVPEEDLAAIWKRIGPRTRVYVF